MRTVRIGLVGDLDATVTAHQAIPIALQLAGELKEVEVNEIWLPTDEITSVNSLIDFDGLWCVPASPYRSLSGALIAIQFAREHHIPFLGTCGGFQHAIIEYARNVLGWRNAEHAESAPDASCAVISPLLCSLVEQSETVCIVPDTRLAKAYGKLETHEGYHCAYGINAEYRDALFGGSLKISAEDSRGEIRAVELDGHPFFVATLFQPERVALRGEVPAVVAEFVRVICAAVTA